MVSPIISVNGTSAPSQHLQISQSFYVLKGAMGSNVVFS